MPLFAGVTNRDIHASTEIWNFFRRHELTVPQGDLVEKTFVFGDSLRSYMLYVPAAYDGSSEWPLVLNLHGAGATAGFHMQLFDTQSNQIADTAHFLVAYPQGIIPVANFPGFAWNASLDPELPDDIGFLNAVIDSVSSSYAVDQYRIYSTGISSGGYLSYALACELPQRIAAVASIAGPRAINFPEPCNVNRPFPVLHMHGTKDPIVPITGGTSPVSLFTYAPVQNEIQFWRDNNDCADDSTVVELDDLVQEDSSTVELRRFSDCAISSDNGEAGTTAEVLYYVIEGGGHTWPGGPPLPPSLASLGHVNQDINASEEIWTFFNRHTNFRTNVTEEAFVLSDISLEENYPNPFRSQTRIPFNLDTVTEVELVVYDVLGRKVAVLVDGLLPAGQHEVRFDAASLSSGLYLYTLKAGDNRRTRKMIVMR